MFEVRVLHSPAENSVLESLQPIVLHCVRNDNLTLHFCADPHVVHVVYISPEFTEADFLPETLKRRNSVKARLTVFSQDSIWSLERQTPEDIGRTWP